MCWRWSQTWSPHCSILSTPPALDFSSCRLFKWFCSRRAHSFSGFGRSTKRSGRKFEHFQWRFSILFLLLPMLLLQFYFIFSGMTALLTLWYFFWCCFSTLFFASFKRWDWLSMFADGRTQSRHSSNIYIYLAIKRNNLLKRGTHFCWPHNVVLGVGIHSRIYWNGSFAHKSASILSRIRIHDGKGPQGVQRRCDEW